MTAMVSDECPRLEVLGFEDMVWFDEKLKEQGGFEMRKLMRSLKIKQKVR